MRASTSAATIPDPRIQRLALNVIRPRARSGAPQRDQRARRPAPARSAPAGGRTAAGCGAAREPLPRPPESRSRSQRLRGPGDVKDRADGAVLQGLDHLSSERGSGPKRSEGRWSGLRPPVVYRRRRPAARILGHGAADRPPHQRVHGQRDQRVDQDRDEDLLREQPADRARRRQQKLEDRHADLRHRRREPRPPRPAPVRGPGRGARARGRPSTRSAGTAAR